MPANIGRNDPCWCGSGKKYKHCHLHQDPSVKSLAPSESELENLLGQFGAESMRRTLEEMARNPSRKEEIRQQVLSHLEKVQREKELGTRPKPSQRCIFGKSALPKAKRAELLDLVASLVDENWAGRSEMCIYFAVLLRDALRVIGISADAVWGEATYFHPDNPAHKFTWNHAWVLIWEEEIVDGNIDSIVENPALDSELEIQPYSFWGSVSQLPGDRTFVRKGTISEEWEAQNMDRDTLYAWRNRLGQELRRLS